MNLTTFERSIIAPLKAKATALDTYYQAQYNDSPNEYPIEFNNSIVSIYPNGLDAEDSANYPAIKMSRTTPIPNMALQREGNLFKLNEESGNYIKSSHQAAYKCRVYFYCLSKNNFDQRKLAEIMLNAFPNGGWIYSILDPTEKIFCRPYTNITSPVSKDKIIEDVFMYDFDEFYLDDPTLTPVEVPAIGTINIDTTLQDKDGNTIDSESDQLTN